MYILSVVFTLFLILLRVVITQTLIYSFFIWNIVLAAVPYYISSKLKYQKRLTSKAFTLLFLWLLFYPNAPYIITDLFHYTQRSPVPYWYDLLICVSAVWNGLILGLTSLLQVEQFLNLHLKPLSVKVFTLFSFILCGYGIYLGRYLRFNSWDIISNPYNLVMSCLERVIHPFQHIATWSFTFLFALMMALFYYTVKSLIDANADSVKQ